jgi:hypothetical protein
MLKKFSNWMRSVSNGWVALSTLVIFLLFTALVLPGQASRTQPYTETAGSPDMSFYYTADDLYQMAEAYGEDGREAYVRARFTFDLIWPMVYMIFLCTGISWVYGRTFAPGSVWQLANLVPILGMLLDYLENIATSIVMMRYPIPTPVVDSLAAVLTMGKWVCVGGSFVLLIVGVGVGVWRLVRERAMHKAS